MSSSKVFPVRLAVVLSIFCAVFPALARAQSASDAALGERLIADYEKQSGWGKTAELDRIGQYVSTVGTRVAKVAASGYQYHFVFDPNPGFKSAFALPGNYIVVGGGLLSATQTEDELANALAHEIEHEELGQVGTRAKAFVSKNGVANVKVEEFFSGYTKQEELDCDLEGQKLAQKAGYSPDGMLTLLESFKSLLKGQPEQASENHPTLAERIGQAQPLAKASTVKQTPLRIP